jgi:DNA-binding CsgD family transcriptional regulator/N-acetylneuraminic acid mutarotase
MTKINALSEREIEVLQYVAAGLTNREIAQKLTISHNTVKVHLSNIFEKINVASRTEATVYAIEHRIVDVPGGESGQQTGALFFLRQVKWYWLAIGALLLVFLIAILTRALFPAPTPPQTATDDVAERWKELAPMPEARQGMAAVAFDGNIYTLAGEGPEGVSGSVFRYLPDEDRWETLSEKPTPVKDVEGVVIGEKIYIPGGETADGKPTNILEIYDPRQDTWETGTPLPQALSDYALISHEGKLILCGGWDGEGTEDICWIYELTTNEWDEGPKLSEAQAGIEAVKMNNEVLIFSGNNPHNQKGTIQIINLYSDSDEWILQPEQPSLPEELSIYSVQNIGNFVFIIGQLKNESSVILNYNPNKNSWSSLYNDNSIEIYSDLAVTSLDGNLILLGGKSKNDQLQKSHWQYNAVYIISIPLINQ